MIRPDRKLISTWLSEVEALPSGKLKHRPYNLATTGDNFTHGVFDIAAIDHQ